MKRKAATSSRNFGGAQGVSSPWFPPTDSFRLRAAISFPGMKIFRPLFLLTSGMAMSMAWLLGAVPGDSPVAPEAPVTTAMGWAALLIPITTPILIAAFKQLIPKIPRVALPVAAPLIGAALQIVLNYAGMTDADTLTGMVLGAAGVALREAVDQVKKLGEPIYVLLLAAGLSLGLTGCARFSAALHDTSKEIKIDGTTIERSITTDLKGIALFSSSQSLARLKALQTDKTQSFGSEGVNQHGATNAVEALREINRMLEKISVP